MVAVSSPLSSVSPGFIDAMRAAYDRDPGQVDASWRCLFQVLDEIDARSPVPGHAGAGLEQAGPLLAEALRRGGHLLARLDPLAASAVGTEAIAAHVAPPSRLSDAALHRVYRGTHAVETGHIDDPSLRRWLAAAVEAERPEPSAAEKRALLAALIEAEEFETFMARRYVGKKRFGLEGGEVLIPLLRRVLEQAAAAGVEQAIVGSMHRGRLNIMVNVVECPAAKLLAEMKGAHPFPEESGIAADVPYHLGGTTTLVFGNRKIAVTLLANPSHLEAVDPVVLGRARGAQDLPERGPGKVLPIVIHTDAAVVAQGIVPETLQLGGTQGFGTGGTIHLVVNNQIGFTTDTPDARTSRHCTGPWKAIDSAIQHVNGDDPLAAMRAADLAVAWRQAHWRDAVIDVVCYRRNGHNEIDEPGFTQPDLYRRIAAHPGVAAQYASALVDDGVMAREEVEAIGAACRARFEAAYREAVEHGHAPREAAPVRGVAPVSDTGVPEARLRAISEKLATPPAGLVPHARMGRILPQRVIGEEGIAWPLAEALAVGSLLIEGTPVRLTGQDVVRGAFSHRHFALVDSETGEGRISLNELEAGQARFAVFNSPLSEYAVLGFEYGYSLERPDTLVMWEAQFGDFANGAQIIIDQFIVAGEEKWRDRSGLVMLLPHGLEGQGPEHSSARIERYLQMAARGNVRIVNCSTPANYFHLLREQGRGGRKPLVVFSPKKLLRLPAAVSPLADFLPGTGFRPVIAGEEAGPVRVVLLCAGKLAYELEAEKSATGADDVAVVRLEQFYPLPDAELSAVVRRYPGAAWRWVQEEPENMGAWSWLDRRLEALLRREGAASPRVAYVGRPEAASPAGSFHDAHEADQRLIVERAFAGRPGAAAVLGSAAQ